MSASPPPPYRSKKQRATKTYPCPMDGCPFRCETKAEMGKHWHEHVRPETREQTPEPQSLQEDIMICLTDVVSTKTAAHPHDLLPRSMALFVALFQDEANKRPIILDREACWRACMVDHEDRVLLPEWSEEWRCVSLEIIFRRIDIEMVRTWAVHLGEITTKFAVMADSARHPDVAEEMLGHLRAAHRLALETLSLRTGDGKRASGDYWAEDIVWWTWRNQGVADAAAFKEAFTQLCNSGDEPWDGVVHPDDVHEYFCDAVSTWTQEHMVWHESDPESYHCDRDDCYYAYEYNRRMGYKGGYTLPTVTDQVSEAYAGVDGDICDGCAAGLTGWQPYNEFTHEALEVLTPYVKRLYAQ